MRELLAASLLLVVAPSVADARLVKLVIDQREVFAGGASWGAVGPYERLVGTAHLEVDPRDPLNAVIVDLDKAPPNARGLVEFRTTVFILKPVDLTRGNGKIYYTANNRGNDALYTARTVEQVGRNDFASLRIEHGRNMRAPQLSIDPVKRSVEIAIAPTVAVAAISDLVETGVERSGRDFVKQGFPDVRTVAIDQDDVVIAASETGPQFSHEFQPGSAATDNDDLSFWC